MEINISYFVQTADFQNQLSYKVTKLYHIITSLYSSNFSMKVNNAKEAHYVFLSLLEVHSDFWDYIFLYIQDFQSMQLCK
jgi:hypothetical protein